MKDKDAMNAEDFSAIPLPYSNIQTFSDEMNIGKREGERGRKALHSIFSPALQTILITPNFLPFSF